MLVITHPCTTSMTAKWSTFIKISNFLSWIFLKLKFDDLKSIWALFDANCALQSKVYFWLYLSCNKLTQILLTLSVPMFFTVFPTLRRLVVIQLILAIETQTANQMKEYCQWFFASWVNFQKYFWKSGKIVL